MIKVTSHLFICLGHTVCNGLHESETEEKLQLTIRTEDLPMNKAMSRLLTSSQKNSIMTYY